MAFHHRSPISAASMTRPGFDQQDSGLIAGRTIHKMVAVQLSARVACDRDGRGADVDVSPGAHSPTASVGALRSWMTVAEIWCAAFTASCKRVPLVRYVSLVCLIRLAGEIEEEGHMVSKREVVPQDESAPESCLHCEINDLVQEHVECQETVDMAEVAARMAESLVDLVLRAPVEQQAQLLAATIAYIGQAFLEKTGGIAGDGNTVQ
jgi:hypothetical protein